MLQRTLPSKEPGSTTQNNRGNERSEMWRNNLLFSSLGSVHPGGAWGERQPGVQCLHVGFLEKWGLFQQMQGGGFLDLEPKLGH